MLEAILAEPPCCLQCPQFLPGQPWLLAHEEESLPACDACQDTWQRTVMSGARSVRAGVSSGRVPESQPVPCTSPLRETVSSALRSSEERRV